MSEYRTPEEDTIGGHTDLDDGEENATEPASGGADEERVEPSDQPD